MDHADGRSQHVEYISGDVSGYKANVEYRLVLQTFFQHFLRFIRGCTVDVIVIQKVLKFQRAWTQKSQMKGKVNKKGGFHTLFPEQEMYSICHRCNVFDGT